MFKNRFNSAHIWGQFSVRPSPNFRGSTIVRLDFLDIFAEFRKKKLLNNLYNFKCKDYRFLFCWIVICEMSTDLMIFKNLFWENFSRDYFLFLKYLQKNIPENILIFRSGYGLAIKQFPFEKSYKNKESIIKFK